jgi:hypothetical protein
VLLRYRVPVPHGCVIINSQICRNLKAHGWQYIVVDIQWSELNPKTHGYRPNAELAMDEYGRLIFAPTILACTFVPGK